MLFNSSNNLSGSNSGSPERPTRSESAEADWFNARIGENNELSLPEEYYLVRLARTTFPFQIIYGQLTLRRYQGVFNDATIHLPFTENTTSYKDLLYRAQAQAQTFAAGRNQQLLGSVINDPIQITKRLGLDAETGPIRVANFYFGDLLAEISLASLIQYTDETPRMPIKNAFAAIKQLHTNFARLDLNLQPEPFTANIS